MGECRVTTVPASRSEYVGFGGRLPNQNVQPGQGMHRQRQYAGTAVLSELPEERLIVIDYERAVLPRPQLCLKILKEVLQHFRVIPL
jgi:hypothetical protein